MKEEIPLSPEELAIGENARINEEIQGERITWGEFLEMGSKPLDWPSPSISDSIDRVIRELIALKSKLREESKNV